MSRLAAAGPRPILVAAALALTAAALAAAAGPLTAQVVRGVVLDNGTGAPIASVMVTVRDSVAVDTTAVTVRTNGDGRFAAQLPTAGEYVVELRHIAYASLTSRSVAVNYGEEVSLEIRLSAQPIELEPVTVVARRFPDVPRLRDFYARAEQNRRSGRGGVLLREDIEKSGAATATHLLELVPRRVRCSYDVYVDDLIVDRRRNIDNVIVPREIEGLEVYSSPAQIPLQYQTRRAPCGVILIWRRPYGGRH
jgi:5-hydroxyisourate hydrolase-like protein (transthyretin family)